MENNCFIGIDVSKNKLDICVLQGKEVLQEDVIDNNPSAIQRFLVDMAEKRGLDLCSCLVCAEHTGNYTYPLTLACRDLGCRLWLENPAQLKYSSGVHRGKNDRVDARRIALYASRFNDKAMLYHELTPELERVKQLRQERSLYRSDLSKYKGQLSDQKNFMESTVYKAKANRLKHVIKELEKMIDVVEREITGIIDSCDVLKRQMKIITSVEGIGRETALCFIVETAAFTRFTDSRKFACHAGIAPFQYTSGSSVRSRNRVSRRANKQVKTLLHMAALSITRKKKSELKMYYKRKVEEGKNKMTVINAIRAKLVARVFAVIRKNDIYSINFT